MENCKVIPLNSNQLSDISNNDNYYICPLTGNSTKLVRLVVDLNSTSPVVQSVHKNAITSFLKRIGYKVKPFVSDNIEKQESDLDEKWLYINLQSMGYRFSDTVDGFWINKDYFIITSKELTRFLIKLED